MSAPAYRVGQLVRVARWVDGGGQYTTCTGRVYDVTDPFDDADLHYFVRLTCPAHPDDVGLDWSYYYEHELAPM
jgi:hypothetical protein